MQVITLYSIIYVFIAEKERRSYSSPVLYFFSLFSKVFKNLWYLDDISLNYQKQMCDCTDIFFHNKNTIFLITEEISKGRR